jgi:hypothetical protein
MFIYKTLVYNNPVNLALNSDNSNLQWQSIVLRNPHFRAAT